MLSFELFTLFTKSNSYFYYLIVKVHAVPFAVTAYIYYHNPVFKSTVFANVFLIFFVFFGIFCKKSSASQFFLPFLPTAASESAVLTAPARS